MSETGATSYAAVGDDRVAFQVLSDGVASILVVTEGVVPMEALQDDVDIAAFLRRLSATGRVVVFDRRGVGLSDRVSTPSWTLLADWCDDAHAVMDAIGIERATIISSGASAGFIGITLAAESPERVAALYLYDAVARYASAVDYPWGMSDEELRHIDEQLETWGVAGFVDRRGRISAAATTRPEILEWATKWLRRGASPSTMKALHQVLRTCDVRAHLGRIDCPTLIVNHDDTEEGRFLARHIPGARYLELSDPAHLVFSSQLDSVMAAISELTGGTPLEPAGRRLLTTLMFTDIVGSTSSLAAAGDRHWSVALDRHDDMVRRQLRRFAGTEVKTTGDGFVAMFDAATLAVQCAIAIQLEAARHGVSVRAGVHSGEIEFRQDQRDIVGLTVHVTERVCTAAQPGQVLITRQVAELADSSGLLIRDEGDHPLKGLDGHWKLYDARLGSGS